MLTDAAQAHSLSWSLITQAWHNGGSKISAKRSREGERNKKGAGSCHRATRNQLQPRLPLQATRMGHSYAAKPVPASVVNRGASQHNSVTNESRPQITKKAGALFPNGAVPWCLQAVRAGTRNETATSLVRWRRRPLRAMPNFCASAWPPFVTLHGQKALLATNYDLKQGGVQMPSASWKFCSEH